jgi:hypothetical protein
LGEFEVDGPEAFEEADEVVGVATADGEVCAAERSPGRRDREVEFFVVDTAKELGVGGGTTSADSGKGAALPKKTTEVDSGAGVSHDFRLVHGIQRAAG